MVTMYPKRCTQLVHTCMLPRLIGWVLMTKDNFAVAGLGNRPMANSIVGGSKLNDSMMRRSVLLSTSRTNFCQVQIL